ncbi:hypothetical protein B0T20DRAFT_347067 [Sordaria brevicollis]|uniref:Kelch repeat-containing protein n=1 Tax=Sordaria brevicollis TaxID=83679 RepID=A0AAE0PM55_SORBR|nr:hypothetical protein B0T20DRAFT_347067 [Sordaria brevicollis]
MDQRLSSSATWKLLPRFSWFSSLILLASVLQTGFAKLVDNPRDGQFLRRGLSRGLIGYSIGGWAHVWSDPDWKRDPEPYAGMISYDMRTKTFFKSNFKRAIPPIGTVRDGRAEYVPQFGPHGLVFVVGGLAFNKDLAKDHMLDMTNITFFDPGTSQWMWQKTTGDAPRSRQSFCMVGVPGPAGTYELFIYGGNDINDSQSYDDFYVLSLPGFRWFQVTDRTPEARAETSCAVIGNRQMVIVGGHDFAKKGPSQSWKPPDEFPQGLGIFDMVDLTFVKNFSYNAHAEAYKTPKVIEDWYRNNTDLSVAVPEWSSDVVKRIFLAKPVTFNNSDSNSTDPGNPQPPPPPPETPPNNSKVGPIVGGVVGAIAGVAMIGFLIYYFWIRRKKPRKLALASRRHAVEMGSFKGRGGGTPSFKTKETTELSTEPLVAEMPASPTDYHSSREETTNGGIYELDVTSRHGELYAPHRT